MKNNLLTLLEQIEETISEAPRIPMTDKVVVDGELLLDMLEQIRFNLPDEVQRAKQIQDDREKLITSGHKDADKIIRQAEEYAKKLIDQHEVTTAAKKEAQKLMDEAQQQAAELRKGADQYAEAILAELADNLRKNLTIVEKGRQKLKNA